MDAYFPVTKSSAATSSKNAIRSTKHDDRNLRKYSPYTMSRNGASKNKSELSNFLLSTLSDPSNPITSSDSGEKSIYVFSTATGHQVSEGGNRRLYLEDRAKKINVQTAAAADKATLQVLVNVKCYINGFLENTTDLEMKRMIMSAGGQVLPTASGATHILTSQHLSGSKTQHLLTTKKAPHVVRPEWVSDTIAAGKRQSEREYSVVKDKTTRNLVDMFRK
ncbi:hypothetical protein C8F04DRAFT_1068526 [Mycena alexandri]|uniref:BRCT domain-containing protein n=1 Tax=Mycena alexandri TaxID=1745969 RepID=A0AAD6TE18_9AGAR|nr:hypothetical protein C8F04DRAFT_1068526 [Mycena alexandri]